MKIPRPQGHLGSTPSTGTITAFTVHRSPFIVFLLSFFVFSSCTLSHPPALSPVSSGSCRSEGLRWLAPDDARERVRLDAWCAGVGEAAMHAALSPVPSLSIAVEDITFASWNVHVGSGDIRAFVKDLLAGKHTEGREVRHYVLLLQEVVRTEGVPPLSVTASGAARIRAPDAVAPIDIVQIARELGLSLIYVPSMRNGASADVPAEDRGNAILSTLPLTEPMAVELPGERQRRVAIIAKAGPVSVAAVHLDGLGAVNRLRVFWTPWMRDRQVRSAASSLPEGVLVMGADLNTWHGRDELAVRFLDEMFRETPLTIDRDGLGLRVLDYMYFRAGSGRRGHYRQLENRYGSDHRPLVGWVE